MKDLAQNRRRQMDRALRWAILLLSYYPDVQQKMQSEIENVIGKERRPTLEDREM